MGRVISPTGLIYLFSSIQIKLDSASDLGLYKRVFRNYRFDFVSFGAFLHFERNLSKKLNFSLSKRGVVCDATRSDNVFRERLFSCISAISRTWVEIRCCWAYIVFGKQSQFRGSIKIRYFTL